MANVTLQFCWFDSMWYFVLEKSKFESAKRLNLIDQEDLNRINNIVNQLEKIIEDGQFNSDKYVSFIALLVQFQFEVQRACKKKE